MLVAVVALYPIIRGILFGGSCVLLSALSYFCRCLPDSLRSRSTGQGLDTAGVLYMHDAYIINEFNNTAWLLYRHDALLTNSPEAQEECLTKLV